MTDLLLFKDIDEPGLHTLDVYARRGGYEALRKALTMTPAEVLHELEVSAIYHCCDSLIRRRLPSTGSLGLVPPLRRYYAALRLPCVPRASLRCLRSALPRCARWFALKHIERDVHEPGLH